MAKECTAPKGAGGVAAMPASDKIRMVIPYMMQNHKVGKRREGGCVAGYIMCDSAVLSSLSFSLSLSLSLSLPPLFLSLPISISP